MDRAGGYGDYLMLQEDARAYEDVLLVLEGESEAAKIRQMKAKSERVRMEAARGRR